ncbi:hypothetical protein BDQ12DRAFT_681496 [Crucibulum laeve]|uniref:RanBP2-type domain-containing protein n=1 Tax=Crucibulum laeve TaxID=68775 RepID=A0A5C3M3Z3_9AGAR|nr:hypothetical protein BDQ12DRAFT_681496 [Crucibulum laeve]
MSAIRTTNSRSRARSALASPYSRPAPKKSPWSLSSLLSYFNPLRSRTLEPDRSPSPEDQDESSDSFEDDSPDYAAQSLSNRGHQLANSVNANANANSQASSSAQPMYIPPFSQSSPNRFQFQNRAEKSPQQDTLQGIGQYLRENAGKRLNPDEATRMADVIDSTAPIFRFESRSPSIPAQGSTPSTFAPSRNSTPAATPRKVLTRNPNGEYRWQGGGSARASRTRNRYSSPAFGPRSTPERTALRDNTVTADLPKTDVKRRRVGEEASASTAAPSGPTVNGTTSSISTQPFPAASPATPRTSNGLISKPTVSRLRTPTVQKPTTPAIPSPLRQAWSQGSSNSSMSDVSQAPLQPPPPKASKTANFMAELIKEVTPPKKPDVSNPYQTASPVGKVGPPRRPVKRPRATGRPPVPTKEQKEKEAAEKEKEKEKEKAKEYSPQAIIEATVPKGSKRSRPPAHFEKSPSSDSRRSPSLDKSLVGKTSYLVEEVEDIDDDESQRSSKKSKSSVNGSTLSRPTITTPEIVIEEVDVDMQGSKRKETTTAYSFATSQPAPPVVSPPSNKSIFGGFKPSSIPKEPSKLRYSVVPPASSPSTESKSAPSGFTLPSPSPSTSTTSTTTPKHSEMDTREDFSTNKKSECRDPKEAARAIPVTSLPTFTFTFTASGTSMIPSDSKDVQARNEAKAIPLTSLPKFDLNTPNAVASSSGSNPPIHSIPVIKSFDWAAAGMKRPASTGGWTCLTCQLTNDSTATEKCAICEAPKPGASKSPTPKVMAFDWAAAGMKKPASTGGWTCSTCQLANDSTATEKCAICEAPKPEASKPPTPKVIAFDWAAAGMKRPTVTGWTCSQCGLANDAMGADKCKFCDGAR